MLLFCLVDEFMLTIYGQNFVTEDKYSSDTEPFHGFSDAEILAAGGTIRGPTPSSDPSGYAPQQWPPSNSHPGDLGLNIKCELSTRTGSA